MRACNCLLACAALILVTGQVFAAETSPPAVAKPIDVALQEGGVLVGQVVTPEGVPLPNATVGIDAGQQVLGVAKTDAQGRFAVRGLKGGVYRLSAADGSGVYRVWAPGMAPRGAQQGTLIVAGQDLTRGQVIPRARTWLRNPWVVGGVIATAIAVPIALSEDDDEEPVSP